MLRRSFLSALSLSPLAAIPSVGNAKQRPSIENEQVTGADSSLYTIARPIVFRQVSANPDRFIAKTIFGEYHIEEDRCKSPFSDAWIKPQQRDLLSIYGPPTVARALSHYNSQMRRIFSEGIACRAHCEVARYADGQSSGVAGLSAETLRSPWWRKSIPIAYLDGWSDAPSPPANVISAPMEYINLLKRPWLQATRKVDHRGTMCAVSWCFNSIFGRYELHRDSLDDDGYQGNWKFGGERREGMILDCQFHIYYHYMSLIQPAVQIDLRCANRYHHYRLAFGADIADVRTEGEVFE